MLMFIDTADVTESVTGNATATVMVIVTAAATAADNVTVDHTAVARYDAWCACARWGGS